MSIVPNSLLLDWDLPGTRPHPEAEAAATRLRAVADQQLVACVETEVYRTEQPSLVRAALEEAQAERHYLRYKDKKDPGLSRWEGPNRLLMVERQDELLLCALDWPLSG